MIVAGVGELALVRVVVRRASSSVIDSFAPTSSLLHLR